MHIYLEEGSSCSHLVFIWKVSYIVKWFNGVLVLLVDVLL
jgi:hypothetical protein